MLDCDLKKMSSHRARRNEKEKVLYVFPAHFIK